MNEKRGVYAREAVWVFLAAFAVYFLTSTPFIGFGDTAILVSAIERGVVVSHVNNHPLTVIIGWLFSSFSSSEPATSANLVSVVFGSLTIALLFITLRLAGVSRGIATLTASSAIVMHSMWWHSTIIENYAVSAALVMATYGGLFFFDRSRNPKGLYLASFFAGLSIFNHVQNGFLCLGVCAAGVLYALSGGGVKSVMRCAGMALLGLLPWIVTVTNDVFNCGSLTTTLRDAFVGKFEGTFFSASTYSMVWDTLYIVWLQSPLLLLPITSLLGILSALILARPEGVSWSLALRQNCGACGALVHILLTFMVFSGYPTWDRFAFLLPALMGLAVFSGLGLSFLAQRALSSTSMIVWVVLTVLCCPVLYSSLVILAKDPNSLWYTRYNNNYSANLYDQARFVANPIRIGYSELEEFARLLETSLPSNSYFLDDDSRTYYTLADYYQRYRNFRRDIQILLVNAWGFSDWGLDAEKLTSIMENAYHTGKPFFVASISRPYSSFFAKAQERFPVSFSPFQIGGGRWVYKLNALPDALARKRQYINDAVAKNEVSPITLLAASGEIDLSLRSVLFTSFDRSAEQSMVSFGPQWSRGNQLFFTAEQAGAQVEVPIVQPTATKRELSVMATVASDFGVVEVALNGRSLGRFDLYSPFVDSKLLALGEQSLSSEGDVLSFRVVDKNPKSSGYFLGLDSLRYQ